MAHRQVMDQVRYKVLVAVLRSKFHKERSRIVKEVVPVFLFFVAVRLERNKVRTERPRQKFQLVLRILEVFDIVQSLRNFFVQVFGTVQQTTLSAHDLRKRITEFIFLAAHGLCHRRRLPNFFLLCHG